jgi:hypothetical protein
MSTLQATAFWFRWVAVIPGAIAAGLLMTIPLRLMLMNTLRYIVDPYPAAPERLLTPIAIGAGMVWAAAKIAPSKKLEAAAVLFGIWMALVGALAVRGSDASGAAAQRTFLAYGGWIAVVTALAGGLVGLWLARRESVASPHISAA